MPPRIPFETVKKFDSLIMDGCPVTQAAVACGVSRDWAFNRAKGRRKRDQAKFYATVNESNLPEPKPSDKLGEDAARALEDFGFFRYRYFGRRSVPWQEKAGHKFAELLSSDDDDYLVMNVSPGGGKSTMLTDACLWMLCRERATRILYGSRTESQATMYTRRIRASLERTEKLRASSSDIKRQMASDAQATLIGDFGKFKPQQPDLWRADRFVISQPNEVVADDKEASVAAFGMDSGVLGGRYDLSVWDDLVDGKNLRTADARERLIAFWESTAECQPGWAVVNMADGTHRRVDEIRAGDRVLSANGTTRVVAVGDNGMQDVYRVTTRAGREVFVTGNHPLLTPSGWVEAKDSLGHGVKSVGAQRGVDEVTRLAEYRERLRATMWDTSFVPDRVVSVEQISTEQTWGIETEDHTYVTGGIVTHNTRCEPGGLVALVGQRLDGDDLYRYALDLAGDDVDVALLEDHIGGEPGGDYKRKYHHVKFRAHDDLRCKGSVDNPEHALDAPAWDGSVEGGCLLDPRRLSWKKLRPMMLHRAERFEVVYQQEDIDPASALVKKQWIDGGVTADGEYVPGCKDDDRGIWELPKGLTGRKFAYVTADPSPTKFWAVQAWVYHPDSEQRFLLDLRRQTMAAPDFLEYDTKVAAHTGLLEDWWHRFEALGVPLTHVFVERNAAQRFLLQYQFVQDWKALRGVRIIGHDTHGANKGDEKFGIQMLSGLYLNGLVRLPMRGSEARFASLKLIDEVTKYPYGGTDDEVLAQWFGEFNLPRFCREDAQVYHLRPMDGLARRAQRVMPGLKVVG